MEYAILWLKQQQFNMKLLM